MKSSKHLSHLLVGVAIVAAGACHKKPVLAPPAPPPGETAPLARTNPGTRDNADSAQAERERLERERLDRERRAHEAADREAMMRALEASVHFEYDRSDLSEASRIVLDAKVRVLAAHPEIRLRIVGHTDDRGSDEYNQALGQRRSAAAHRYLTMRGVAAVRLDYVSVGEGRPRCPESTEACRAENRRAEFEIIYY
jgi:peptidoglycan-associated lipoprotein